MRHSPFLLPVAGFTIAVGCALAPRPMPAPFYGIDPDTKACTLGAIEGTCNTGTAVRCTVTIGSNFGIPAFDNKSGTMCTTPVFRPGSVPPPPDTLTLK
jgi:hypothetical protein